MLKRNRSPFFGKGAKKMKSGRISGTATGVLYIIGTVAGVLSVVFTGPIGRVPDYFMNLPAGEGRLIMGALCVLIMGLALAMVPVVVFPIARKYNETLALGYVVFRGALETFTYMVTVISWLALLPLGRAVARGDVLDAPRFKALGALILEGDVLSSVTTIVFILGALMFYYVLYQSKLVPRWISGWGILSTLPYLVAGFLVIFGLIGHMSTVDTVLRLPLALQEMVLAIWLIAKGFNRSEVA
jgi:hypothetical protein